MSQRIIYEMDGQVCIVVPSPEALTEWGIAAIALKDVPHGKPFKIVDVADIPGDRTFRNAWEVDASTLTDGVGAESNEFPKPAPADEEPAPTEPAPVEEVVQ
jgi:hypothetical protein